MKIALTSLPVNNPIEGFAFYTAVFCISTCAVFSALRAEKTAHK